MCFFCKLPATLLVLTICELYLIMKNGLVRQLIAG